MALISCGGTEEVPTTSDVASPNGEQSSPAEPTATREATPTPRPEPSVEPTEPATTEPATPQTTSAPVEGFDAPGDLVVPDPLAPGSPGELIASEDFLIGRLDGPALEGHRLLYHSQSVAGTDVAVSGFVILPSGAPPEGGWPLIAWAHGTTGIGDGCAPSLVGRDPSNFPASRLAADGYAVVATDYEGLGTPGRHPYIVGASEAHSVLDSVRAVHNMGLPVTDEWIAFGYSQGGHAAMFTAQLQPSYAPELELIGTIAGAPPSQFSSLFESLVGSEYQAYLVMTIAGHAAAFPEVDLAAILTPEAMDLLEVVDTGCAFQIFEAFTSLPWEGTVRQVDVIASGPFADRIMKQDTNRLPTHQPLMIIHGDADEQVPIETSALLFDQLCAFEDQAPAIRIVYPGEPHGGAIWGEAAWPDLLEWTAARFAGEPAPDDC